LFILAPLVGGVLAAGTNILLRSESKALVHPRVNDSDVLCWSDATFSIEAQAW
jgi:hypothetical protein